MNKPVALIYEPKGPYRPALDAAVESFRKCGHECVLIEVTCGDEAALKTAIQQIKDLKPAAVLTAGTLSTIRVLEALPDLPVVFCMVPNVLDSAFLVNDSPFRKRAVGVSSDIDPTEQMSWIARTQPRAKKIGLLYSERTEKTAASLQEAGKKLGLEPVLIPARRDDFLPAVEALDQKGCDGVLMIPDSQVFNSANVERLLLWGVRQKKAVWAFSENVVKAGAFSGLYCDIAEIGRQAAALTDEIIHGKKPALNVQYPQLVRRAINVHTTEMIEAPLDEKMLASNGVTRLGEQK